jgi:glycosyltransferase involved in cell wall biosynthesis
LSSPEIIQNAIKELNKICSRVKVFPIPSEKTILHWSIMTAISYFRRSPYDCNWLYNKEMYLFIEDLSKRETFDLVHIDTLGMFPYSIPFNGIPMILNHHNIESNMMHRRFENEANTIKKMYFKRESVKLSRYENYVCKQCNANLVVSDLDAFRLKEIVRDVEIVVVPNGVDLEYFLPQTYARGNEGGLIFAGPMDWYPNRTAVLFFLSEIIPKLREDKIDLPVTIVGRNPLKELILAAKKYRISVPGYVDDVRPYISSADIYVCPIKDGGGTRLKILDALAMGKPLVATGLAVEGLDLVDEEHYLRAEEGAEFVEKIRRLMGDKDLSERIALQGRRFVENRYSWEIIGEEMDQAYQKAVRSSLS